MATNQHDSSDKTLIGSAKYGINDDDVHVKKQMNNGKTEEHAPDQQDSNPDEDTPRTDVPPVNLVADGAGNHNPDAAHEVKASTLEKQRVDAILDEEEARQQAKHQK